MEMTPKEMGAYLKKLREDKGLSTREVFERSKVSNSYLSLVENGHRRASAVVLKKLAPVYGVDYLDLYVKAGYADLIEDEKKSKYKNNDFRYASFQGLDLEGLDEDDIKELNQFVEFIKNKKKNDKK